MAARCQVHAANRQRQTIKIRQTLTDLKNTGCNILTIGQYIQPSKEHLSVAKFYTLEEYEQLKQLAYEVGFIKYQIGPLVRSSYNASELG